VDGAGVACDSQAFDAEHGTHIVDGRAIGEELLEPSARHGEDELLLVEVGPFEFVADPSVA